MRNNLPNKSLPDKSRAALERLIEIAQSDTGQSRIVANFLLAWWNAKECGGFDLTEVWGVDTEIALDMLRVFALVASAISIRTTWATAVSSMPSCASGGRASF